MKNKMNESSSRRRWRESETNLLVDLVKKHNVFLTSVCNPYAKPHATTGFYQQLNARLQGFHQQQAFINSYNSYELQAFIKNCNARFQVFVINDEF